MGLTFRRVAHGDRDPSHVSTIIDQQCTRSGMMPHQTRKTRLPQNDWAVFKAARVRLDPVHVSRSTGAPTAAPAAISLTQPSSVSDLAPPGPIP